MALTELERQKDSISWEPISERADFITTLSYKRGSTIPLCRTLVFTKEYYKAGSNFITTLSYNQSTSQHCFVPKIFFFYNFFKNIMKQKQTLSQHCIGLKTGFNCTIPYFAESRILRSRNLLYQNIVLAYKWGSSHFGGGVEEKTAIVELLLRIQGFIYVAKN